MEDVQGGVSAGDHFNTRERGGDGAQVAYMMLVWQQIQLE